MQNITAPKIPEGDKVDFDVSLDLNYFTYMVASEFWNGTQLLALYYIGFCESAHYE